MKFQCLQENLNSALNIVTKATAQKPLPILNYVLLEASNDRLWLRATNLEVTITVNIVARVLEPGRLCVEAKRLSDFVSNLPTDRIDFDIAYAKLRAKCAKREARIGVIDAKEFPAMPTVSGGQFVIPADTLRKALKRVLFAAANDKATAITTGVSFRCTNNKLVLAATDAICLGVQPLCDFESVELVLSASVLEKLVGSITGEVIVTIEKDKVGFSWEGAELICLALQGNFPKYESFLMVHGISKATINRDEFFRDIKLANSFTRDSNGIVRLVISNNQVAIRSSIEDTSEEFNGSVEAVTEGEEMRVAFNIRYLLNILSALDEEYVTLEVQSVNQVALLYPVGSETRYIISPMIVNW